MAEQARTEAPHLCLHCGNSGPLVDGVELALPPGRHIPAGGLRHHRASAWEASERALSIDPVDPEALRFWRFLRADRGNR